MKIRLPFQFLFLVFVVAGLYYPSIFALELSVDDTRMLNGLINRDTLDLAALFFPSGAVYYFRPLIGLSFYADRYFFFCHPAIMHLENILLHTGNSCLLFWFARQFLTPKAAPPGCNNVPPSGDLPFLIALLFAVHPLATEPVNWVSGRTDLLAGFFTLLTLNLFWKNRTANRWHIEWLAALCLLLALLSKEVAAAALIVMVAALFWQGMEFRIPSWPQRVRIIFPYTLSLCCYFFLRSGPLFSLDNGLRSALAGTKGAENFTPWVKIVTLIKALGFYTVKIVWPFPLNFAIVQVDTPRCLTAGILAIVLLAWLCLRHRGKFSFLVASAFFFIAPALLVASSKMAWTPLAERYLYIPLMFFACTPAYFHQRLPARLYLGIFGLVLFTLASATVSRNLTWQSNLSLFADVVAKSPAFAAGHNEYAAALARAGKPEQAKRHFELAAQLSRGSAQLVAKANLAWMDTRSTDFLTSVDTMLREDTSSPMLSKDILQATTKHLDRLSLQTKDPAERQRIIAKNIEITGRLYTFDKNPFFLYRQGQLYLALGENRQAEENFRQVCSLSNDYYTKAACKLAAELNNKRTGKK